MRKFSSLVFGHFSERRADKSENEERRGRDNEMRVYRRRKKRESFVDVARGDEQFVPDA